MKKEAKSATLLGIFGNLVLFILKIVVGVLYNSMALISDGINSFTDIIASVIVYISVKVSSKRADKGHPFGHHRAEPIAGLIVAIFTAILGFEIISISTTRLMQHEIIIASIVPIIVLLITMISKSCMYFYTIKIGKRMKSPAILASATDHRNDILVSFAALVGISGAKLGYVFLDPLAALLIGIWIIKAGYNIGAKNVRYLIGEAAPRELQNLIRKKVLQIAGVKGVHDLRAHYVGVLLQLEVHISVDRKITIYRAHTIGEKVQSSLEALEEIDKAFVHIDPLMKTKKN